ncbi:unnamed protein product [Schistosoma margrebowiei]|uniref:Uncharacterized protein n=1 Tax=Schistosoma margrebowiei TaxID=48269 RepID=A0A183LPL1_9TREM|nr:unnamed protein product [Schistosoma margrebowiei]
MKQLYDTTKELAGKYGKRERSVKDKVSKTITEIQGQGNRCVERLEKRSNRPASLSTPDIEVRPADLPINVTPSTIEGIRMVIRQIKSGKAVEPDNIPAETLKIDDYF